MLSELCPLAIVIDPSDGLNHAFPFISNNNVAENSAAGRAGVDGVWPFLNTNVIIPLPRGAYLALKLMIGSIFVFFVKLPLVFIMKNGENTVFYLVNYFILNTD